MFNRYYLGLLAALSLYAGIVKADEVVQFASIEVPMMYQHELGCETGEIILSYSIDKKNASTNLEPDNAPAMISKMHDHIYIVSSFKKNNDITFMIRKNIADPKIPWEFQFLKADEDGDVNVGEPIKLQIIPKKNPKSPSKINCPVS
ncbi:MAG: hypothetical protein K0R14_1695 [Burkholderiales bacterium]|jgi:hypothetical protein|nr:hypothetical protein [Burkholderiales bacterium]